MLKGWDWKHTLQTALFIATGVFTYMGAHATDGSIPFKVSAGFCATVLFVLGIISKSALGTSGSASGGGAVPGSGSAPALKIVSAIMFVICIAGCSFLQSKGPALATFSADTIICVLQHSGEPPAAVALACGIAEVSDVEKILSAHLAAERREGAAKPSPAPDAGPIDAGATSVNEDILRIEQLNSLSSKVLSAAGATP